MTVLVGDGTSTYAETFELEVNPAPIVTSVFARGTGSGSADWGAAYLAYLAANGLGDATLGYRLSNGVNQLTTLPWRNVNTVSFQFSEAVTIEQNDLTIVTASNGAAAPAVSGFAWNASTNVATWTFASALPLNKYLLHFSDGTVVDVDGAALDGEWTDTTSTQSGNGIAGGDFNFRFNVLPADTDGNTTVAIGEALQRRLHTNQSTATPTYSYREDLDGLGTIVLGFALQSRLLTSTSTQSLNEPIVPGGSPLTASALPAWLTAESEEHVSPFAALTMNELAPLVVEAIARWNASGLVPADVDWTRLHFAIADLGGYLGLTDPDGLIRIDDDGSGWGWFVDMTPTRDEEFTVTDDPFELAANAEGPAADRVDLLTTIMHEIGNFLGYHDIAPDQPPAVLLTATLSTDYRRLPVQPGTPQETSVEEPLVGPQTVGKLDDVESISADSTPFEVDVDAEASSPRETAIETSIPQPTPDSSGFEVEAGSFADSIRPEHAALALWSGANAMSADRMAPIASSRISSAPSSYATFELKSSAIVAEPLALGRSFQVGEDVRFRGGRSKPSKTESLFVLHAGNPRLV